MGEEIIPKNATVVDEAVKFVDNKNLNVTSTNIFTPNEPLQENFEQIQEKEENQRESEVEEVK